MYTSIYLCICMYHRYVYRYTYMYIEVYIGIHRYICTYTSRYIGIPTYRFWHQENSCRNDIYRLEHEMS